MFSRVRIPSRSGLSSASGDRSDRPTSARGSSFVDRLRNMQLSTPSSSVGQTRPGGGSSGGAGVRPSSRSGAASPNPMRSVSGPPVRPVGGGGVTSSVVGSGVRRVPSKEPLGHSSAHSSSSTSSGGGGLTAAARSGRTTPTPGAQPTGGLRVGATSPPPRSPGKLAPRDVSPVKTTQKLSNAPRPTGATTPFIGLKVGITLMTRKPHRFDWYARAAAAASAAAALATRACACAELGMSTKRVGGGGGGGGVRCSCATLALAGPRVSVADT